MEKFNWRQSVSRIYTISTYVVQIITILILQSISSDQEFQTGPLFRLSDRIQYIQLPHYNNLWQGLSEVAR